MTKILYLIAGLTCLLLGLVGVVLPLLPTTPFVLLAAFCFSRSSESLHRKLLENKLFGPLIRDWEDNGVIPLKAKCIGSSMMILMVSYPLIYRDFAIELKALVVLTIICVLCYIWSRPSVAVITAKAGINSGR
ncbi:YbaN family protein [Marinobacterium jannaschii]|uniref:YbaN family protein n=1 Tax=Marinobacterium jannaschii TaxID=64970 RepID=UPI00048547E0|nr:YbaN family protein [Marinobacterium jannaschii]